MTDTQPKLKYYVVEPTDWTKVIGEGHFDYKLDYTVFEFQRQKWQWLQDTGIMRRVKILSWEKIFPRGEPSRVVPAKVYITEPKDRMCFTLRWGTRQKSNTTK